MPNSRLLWPTHEELRQRYELMDRMMEARRVDVLTALGVDGGLAFIEARAKCRYCQLEGICRHWLASERQRGSADFCPNAAFFRSCPSIDS
ncbi:MAG: DUF6455 family protein [Methyloceanibacter sp.]|uniref:DUF6455 family protein n=1 Tax=Methyloceanibacter sp. TaxID=1965321 RepID=UPI003EDFB407